VCTTVLETTILCSLVLVPDIPLLMSYTRSVKGNGFQVGPQVMLTSVILDELPGEAVEMNISISVPSKRRLGCRVTNGISEYRERKSTESDES